MAHYAILVAITSYPGLSDLQGPENDIDAFYAWLVDEAGGNVKPSENICVIRSSDYPKVKDPYQAQPADTAFRAALRNLLFDEDGTFKDNVGERLYLFFAGHGFASKQLSEAALYSAQATKMDPDHIAGKRYAAKIVNSAAFHEVVLVMDCCRDVDLSDSIRDPNMKIPDRQALAANVRLLEAYGSGRGQQAREKEMPPDLKVRGFFTQAFIDALRNAPVNGRGELTGTLLKGYIHDRWPSMFSGEATYEAHIGLPTGAKDIVFVKRAVPKVVVHVHAGEPLTAGETISILDTARRESARFPYDPQGTSISLPPGYYKAIVVGTARAQMFDAVGESVEVIL
jgi:hypothetical protein